jgi:hypothetical protein
VRDGQVAKEYIPANDLENLNWIEPELDHILLDAFDAVVIREDHDFLKAMGDAAELMILAALELSGANPTHVSRLSDSYGYDIECSRVKPDRIEVKAASRASSARFHISRNEFDKSILYGNEWRLVQVVFSGLAFVSNQLDVSHVETVRELRHGALQKFVPHDTPNFKWTESAQISPTEDAWVPVDFNLDPDFLTPGFRRATHL